MKITYDPEVDALYIEFRQLESGTASPRQLTDEVIADYAPDGSLVGLEILDARRVLAYAKDRMIFEIEPIFNSLGSKP